MIGTLALIILFMFCITIISYTAGYADGASSRSSNPRSRTDRQQPDRNVGSGERERGERR